MLFDGKSDFKAFFDLPNKLVIGEVTVEGRSVPVLFIHMIGRSIAVACNKLCHDLGSGFKVKDSDVAAVLAARVYLFNIHG